MAIILAVYPNHAGSRFDAGYYRGAHARLAAELLGPHGLLTLRINEGLASLDGAPPAFWAVSEMHFSSRQAFDQAITACGAELFADATNYTDVEPILQHCGRITDTASRSNGDSLS